MAFVGRLRRGIPIHSADSIGGDLFSEEYTFGGGYGRRGRRAAWGIEGGVRALHEWRTVDPPPPQYRYRPRLPCGGGAARGTLHGRGLLRREGVQTDGRRRLLQPARREGRVPPFGSGGPFRPIHGRGPRGRSTAAAGTRLCLRSPPPMLARGLYLSLEYVRQRVEKILVAYNNLPLQRIVPQSVSFGAAWTARSGAVRWGARPAGAVRQPCPARRASWARKYRTYMPCWRI